MDLNDTIMQLLSLYQLPAIFVGSFLFGETIIITAAFLSAQGLWSVTNVFLIALVGTVLSDLLWFLFSQKIVSFFRKREKYKQRETKLLLILGSLEGKRPFLSLLFIKFLYGTRILTIMYLSIRKISFLSFIIFDTIGSIIWLAVIIPIGWLAGKSIINFAPFLNKFEYALLLLIFVILIFRLGTIWLSKKITKE